MNHKYRTIVKTGKSLHKAKGSKHHGYAFFVNSEEEISTVLTRISEEHRSAGHVAYAWRLGPEKDRYRANDDGEPSNSAGKPILGQIEKFDLTNVLVAVVRYFGGTKLGVGGLIDAYRTAAAMALEDSQIKEVQRLAHFSIHFGYERMSEVMFLFRTRPWSIKTQNFAEACTIEFTTDPKNKSGVIEAFNTFNDIRIESFGII